MKWWDFFRGEHFDKKLFGRQNTIFVILFVFVYPAPAYTQKNDVNNPAFEGRQYILYVHIDGELCNGFSVNFEIGKIWHH